jgi:hypothetical protein
MSKFAIVTFFILTLSSEAQADQLTEKVYKAFVGATFMIFAQNSQCDWQLDKKKMDVVAQKAADALKSTGWSEAEFDEHLNTVWDGVKAGLQNKETSCSKSGVEYKVAKTVLNDLVTEKGYQKMMDSIRREIESAK